MEDNIVMVNKVNLALLPLLLVMSEQMQNTKDMWVKKWDLYFEVMGFSELAAITGYTVEQFKVMYESFTYRVQDRLDTFEYEKDTQYAAIKAGVSIYGGLSMRMHFPHKRFGRWYDMGDLDCFYISILKGFYLPICPKKIEFRTCEEVMRGLIILFYENRDMLERKSNSGRYEYFPQEFFLEKLGL